MKLLITESQYKFLLEQYSEEKIDYIYDKNVISALFKELKNFFIKHEFDIKEIYSNIKHKKHITDIIVKFLEKFNLKLLGEDKKDIIDISLIKGIKGGRELIIKLKDLGEKINPDYDFYYKEKPKDTEEEKKDFEEYDKIAYRHGYNPVEYPKTKEQKMAKKPKYIKTPRFVVHSYYRDLYIDNFNESNFINYLVILADYLNNKHLRKSNPKEIEDDLTRNIQNFLVGLEKFEKEGLDILNNDKNEKFIDDLGIKSGGKPDFVTDLEQFEINVENNEYEFENKKFDGFDTYCKKIINSNKDNKVLGTKISDLSYATLFVCGIKNGVDAYDANEKINLIKK